MVCAMFSSNEASRAGSQARKAQGQSRRTWRCQGDSFDSTRALIYTRQVAEADADDDDEDVDDEPVCSSNAAFALFEVLLRRI